MPQATTSSAFLRLKPLEKTNTGAIVEEHIRYWTKRKDDKEALALTQKARENEFKRKVAKQTFDNYAGLSDVDAKGYFTEQLVQYKEANASKWLDLSKKASKGDENAIISYAQEKEKLNNLVNASVIVSEQSKKLADMKVDGTFNEYLDSDLENFVNQLAKSNYALDPKLGKFRIYDKDNPEVLLEVDPLNLNNEFLNSTYHKSVDFTKTGSVLAKGLLDSQDGSKEITSDTRIRGIQLAQNQLAQDPVLAKSWYINSKNKGYITSKKSFEELDDVELSNLDAVFYDNAILPNISETVKDTELEDAIKRERLAKLRKERKEDTLTKTISIATTEEGGTIDLTSAIYRRVGLLQGDTMFTIKGKGISFDEVEGDKDTRTTYTNFARGKEGVVAIGKKVIREREPLFNPDGSPQTDGSGNQKFTTSETTSNVVENDKLRLNSIATGIENKEGNKFKDLNELDTELKDLLEGRKVDKTYSKEQESTIKKNMDANPDYSRVEIIEALGF